MRTFPFLFYQTLLDKHSQDKKCKRISTWNGELVKPTFLIAGGEIYALPEYQGL
jgi:hypothetical protein